MPVSALVDFTANNRDSGPMWYLIYPPLTEKCVGGGHQGLDVYKEILWSCARQSSTLVALGLTTYIFFY